VQNRAITRGGRSWATDELTLLAVDVLLQGMDELGVNQGMEDLAVNELQQGMEVGRHPCQDAKDGRSNRTSSSSSRSLSSGW
jgi:hypothetical protein